jgi:hypothetical protein
MELPASFVVSDNNGLWWGAVIVSFVAIVWAIWQSKRETGAH